MNLIFSKQTNLFRNILKLIQFMKILLIILLINNNTYPYFYNIFDKFNIILYFHLFFLILIYKFFFSIKD